MASLLPFKSFNEEDDISCFLERLEQYFTANDITEAKQVSILLISLHENVYKILKGIVHPTLPKDKSYKNLTEALLVRFKPRVAYFRMRIIFDKLQQREGESIAKWYARIREKAAECEFSATIIEERVRDKFVSGLSPGPIQDRLCEESLDKTAVQLLDIALNKESTFCKRQVTEVTVDKVSNFSNKGNQKFTSDSNRNKKPEQELKCVHCGKPNHSFSKCKYKVYRCKICNKVGHLALVCRSNQDNNYLNFSEKNECIEDNMEVLTASAVGRNSINYVSPFIIKCHIKSKPIEMELDTGAAVSCIPETVFKKNFPEENLQETELQLKTYNGQVIRPVGKVLLPIAFKDSEIQGELIVVKNGSKSLLGRDLIKKLNLNVNKCMSIDSIDNFNLQNLLGEYSELFKNELGVIKGEEIKLELTENVKPIFYKPFPIPHAYKEKVNDELRCLEQNGVITKIENSKWGTPLVPVMRENGKMRLCANYKVTINKYLKDFNYPLPKIEDIFTALQGGKKFTKLDLRNAFNQLLLDSETSELLAWSTPKGIYKLNRLPYGTKPASAIFQAKLEKVLLGAKGVVNFIDDVLVTGSNDIEHLQNLKEVLRRFKEAGIRLNKSKCCFFQNEIKYLGHIISQHGLKKDNSKLEAITNAPAPKTVTQVKSWIGMVNYYSKFIPYLSVKLKPMYNLLQKNAKFNWSKECQRSFDNVKKDLVSDKVLVHFDRRLQLRLACDASQSGIGSVLSHVMPDGSEKPIVFISRVYTKAENNYSMIHKEALAIYWSVQKLYQYLVGTKFELQSDHKPLQALFGENKSLPQMAAGRLQRWSLFLSEFDYTFKYIKGSENIKADCMSRLPLQAASKKEIDSNKICDYINFIEDKNVVDLNLIRSETRKDPVLSIIFNMIRYGFSDKSQELNSSETLKPYLSRKNELYIDKGVIMWGYRVVIPAKLRNSLLLELHSTHQGIIKMKSNARSYFWWPNLDKHIEEFIKNCNICMSSRAEPKKAQVISWPKTDFPYERIHADFLGPVDGKIILLIIDSYSKWPEAFIMKGFDSKLAIEKFRECFSRYGLPKIVVTDNARTFVSQEFSNFLSKNGIKHLTSPPFHPASNGFAENAVRSFKSGLLKALKDSVNKGVSFETLMNRYLFSYRTSIHVVTNASPAELMFQRKLRTRLDILTCNDNYKNAEGVQRGKREEIFKEGDMVYCRDYRNPNKKQFIKCIIDEVLGQRLYLCKVVGENLIWKRHLNQIINASSSKMCVNEEFDTDEAVQDRSMQPTVSFEPQRSNIVEPANVLPQSQDYPNKIISPSQESVRLNSSLSGENSQMSPMAEVPSKMSLRRSERTIKPPQRLNL